ncbi:MAG: arylsulfatase [Candidatus Cryptobacteroides sp.]
MRNIQKIKMMAPLAIALPAAASCGRTEAPRPNIIVILADDMGYSDIGCYGGEIETPNIDGLASEGLRWRQFYNNARSCPSRACLLTGLYPHQAGMGWMAAADMGRPEYQGYLNQNCVTLAEALKGAGYGTYMAGKWHVSNDRQNQGKMKDDWPCQRGFDRFYGIPGGASNYFKTTMVNDNEPVPSGEDFYFTKAISDSAAAFVRRHDYEDRPLFMYLAFTAPHWPLHAIQSDIDKYVERYRAGWDKLRAERFERQKAMGLFSDNLEMSARDAAVDAWDSLTPEQQEEFTMRMAIYAAQVDVMDQGVGKVVKALKEAGQFENTVIMFMSDNGACAEFISSGDRKAVDGKADTWESYRINWANLSSTPYREYKHYTNEGGIASPLVVSWPAGIPASRNGSFVDEYGYFADIMATCMDLSGGKYPEEYNGHKIQPMEGVSLVPNFNGKPTGRGLNFWEHEANIAVRDGKWKIVLKTGEGNEFKPENIELYDMEADPIELHNLVDTYPERAKSMLDEWYKWAERLNIMPLDTRFYGQRQQDFRRLINGDFRDNFGGWATKDAEGDVTFSIENDETRGNYARIVVSKSHPKDNAAFLKWNFPTTEPMTLATGFEYTSDIDNVAILRIEETGNPANKLLDKKITLQKGNGTVYFDGISIPKKGKYQMVIYLGKSKPGTIDIDNVKLDFAE